MGDLARALIVIGAVIAAAGLLLLLLPRVPFGRLPGDIVIKRDTFTFYFPFTTGVILSIVISLVLFVMRKLR